MVFYFQEFANYFVKQVWKTLLFLVGGLFQKEIGLLYLRREYLQYLDRAQPLFRW